MGKQDFCENNSRSFEIIYNSSTRTFSCYGENGSRCSYDRCVCTLQLAVDVYERVKTQSLSQVVDDSCTGVPVARGRSVDVEHAALRSLDIGGGFREGGSIVLGLLF